MQKDRSDPFSLKKQKDRSDPFSLKKQIVLTYKEEFFTCGEMRFLYISIHPQN
jgi:hypothetical protein